MDNQIHQFLLLDQLEYAPSGIGNPVRYDGMGWIGGDYNRLWLFAEGEHLTAEGEGEAEVQALYGRLVAPFWDALVGVRLDTRYREGDNQTRGLLTVGLEGLAPYWFEVSPMLFVSQDGDVSARLTTEYELLFTQRLILQPRMELNAALQKVPEFGVGSGLNDVELGTRLRYEIRREFAPYVGINWTRRVGSTADLARAAGEDASNFSVVAGVRMWY